MNRLELECMFLDGRLASGASCEIPTPAKMLKVHHACGDVKMLRNGPGGLVKKRPGILLAVAKQSLATRVLDFI